MTKSRLLRLLTMAVIIVALTLYAPFVTHSNADVTIGIIGDQFGVDGAINSLEFNNNFKTAYEVLNKGVSALNQAGPVDVVLHIGDLVESGMTEPEIKTAFQSAVTILNSLNSKHSQKWYLTPGDHDVNPPGWSPNSVDRSREKLFQALYSKINKKVVNNLYYSFDVNGYHFVELNSLEHLNTDPRWGNVFLAQISDDQLKWLEKDLAAANTSKGVIAFTHQPLWYNWSSWLNVHKILAKYNTKVVVAGHVHYDQSEYQLDGIQYRTVGATGGSIKDANPAAGGWWHVSRLTISDIGTITWQLIPIGEYSKKDFTDRYDMDRIQALSYNLSNSSQWLAKQKLYVKDKKLVNKTCQPESSPAIVLSGFGNPIDLNVAIDIAIMKTPKYKISSGEFVLGMCESPQTGLGCKVKASANTAVSNNSIVIPSCGEFSDDYIFCKGNTPFWTGVVASADVPLAGDTLTVTMTMSYQSKNGEVLRISQDAQIAVEACK